MGRVTMVLYGVIVDEASREGLGGTRLSYILNLLKGTLAERSI